MKFLIWQHLKNKHETLWNKVIEEEQPATIPSLC